MTPAAFFAEVDLAVFPSRVAESFGLVAAEAMAAGTPYVVSDAGALPEVALERNPSGHRPSRRGRASAGCSMAASTRHK